MEKVIVAHMVLVPLLFGLTTGHFLMSLIFSLLIGGIGLLVIRSAEGTKLSQITVGTVMMMFSALMMQILGGRIEAHFHIFALITSMVIYRDIIAMLTSVVVIAVHHVIFNYLQLFEVSIFDQPIIIFSYGCGLDIVLLHAAYVVL
jgi:hypothetical protein